MARAKFKLYVTDQVYATVTVAIELSKDQELLAEALGIGKEERANLLGQELQGLLLLMGNSDEA